MDPLSSLLHELGSAGFPKPYPTELLVLQTYVGHADAFDATFARSADGTPKASEDGHNWGKDREVRAELIRVLCTNRVARSYADPHGVWVSGARVTGELDLAVISVDFPIVLENCYFEAPPRFVQAEVRELNLNRSFVPGFEAGSITVKGPVGLQGFMCLNGIAQLALAQIGGNLDCSGANFSNPDRLTPLGERDEKSGAALVADQATIKGLVRLQSSSTQPFSAVGQVSLVGAQILGDLICSGGRFTYASTQDQPTLGLSLSAERAVIKGAVFLNGDFESLGEVRFVDAQIGASLFCEGGHFKSDYQAKEAAVGSAALQLERASVNGTARFGNYKDENGATRQLQVVGRMTLVDAKVGGVLVTDGADLRSATLDLSGATASGISDWVSAEQAYPQPSTWPLQGHLYLKRFVYGAIVGGTQSASRRLDWLALQPEDDFNSDSYAQLASVLLQAGDDDGSRLVLEELKRLRRRHEHPLSWYLWPNYWGWRIIGQGYHPERAAFYSLILSLLGWIIYRRSYLAGSLVPTDKDAYARLRDEGRLPPNHPRLSTLMMSLETSLPLVKLGQADKWQPGSLDPPARPFSLSGTLGKPTLPKPTRAQLFAPLRRALGLEPQAGGRSVNTPLSRAGTSPGFVRGFMWVQILLGWLLATFFLYGLSDLIKK